LVARPTRRFLSAPAFWALVCLPGLLVACAGQTGFKPTLGEPRAGGPVIYQTPNQTRYDFFVYLPNTSRALDDHVGRLKEVERLMRGRCKVARLEDLYAHDVGMWPDGRVRTYYTIGVRCTERPPAVEGEGRVQRP
jgi:hypothetical protein